MNTPQNQLKTLPLCKGKDCVTLGYAIIGDKQNSNDEEYDWIHHTMKYAANKNKLKFGEDVKQIVLSNTTLDVKRYLDDNMNKTWYGVVF
jgi:hypothetical protein